MRAMYDADIDLLEVMDGTYKTVGMHVSDTLTVFYRKKDRKLIGFALEAASRHMRELENMPQHMLLAGLVRLVRGVLNDTQKQFADRVGTTERTIQRLETGDGANPTLETLNSLVGVTPATIGWAILLSRKHAAASNHSL